MHINLVLSQVIILAKCPLFFGVFVNHWHPKDSKIKDLNLISRISGGHNAKPHSYPYIVSLQLRFLLMRAHFCAGTIITKSWILTAGHCIQESWVIRWLPMDAIAGANVVNEIQDNTQVFPIEERIAHPLYKTFVHDIGLLRTSKPFKWSDEIQPAYLPQGFDAKSNLLQLSGWGSLSTTLFLPHLPDVLQEVSLDYIPYEECYKAVENLQDSGEKNPVDKLSHICTGPLTGGISGCSGDSGGPLIQYVSTRKLNNVSYYGFNKELISLRRKNDGFNKDFVPVVIGVVSWGINPCGLKGAPSVFTNVTNYLDFINKHIEKHNRKHVSITA